MQSIERAAAMLRLLATSPGRLGIVEIARALDLAKGTAHGIIRTLQGVGFVDQDPDGKYRLGAALLHLGTSGLDVNELRSRSINWADPLAARSGEAVRIGTMRDGRVLVVHHVFRPDDSVQTLDTGALLPLHASALGKVLLASAPQSSRPSTLERFTGRTLVAWGDLSRELALVRKRGFAFEAEEFLVGEASLAAPIRGYGGLVVGAIGISGPAERLCSARRVPHARLAGLVRDAARAISRDLGSSHR